MLSISALLLNYFIMYQYLPLVLFVNALAASQLEYCDSLHTGMVKANCLRIELNFQDHPNHSCIRPVNYV